MLKNETTTEVYDERITLLTMLIETFDILNSDELVRDMIEQPNNIPEFCETIKEVIKSGIGVLSVATIPEVKQPTNLLLIEPEKRTLVSVRPVLNNPDDRTYIGFLIGNGATGVNLHVSDNQIQIEYGGYNPIMYVPEIGRLVHGKDSWWSVIETEDEFRDITNDDIENTWYVKLIREQLRSS